MKVKELIEELKKCDQDAVVVVSSMGNEPVYSVEQKPGYWDGSYGELIIDESKKPYYCIEGYNFTRKDYKVCLQVATAADILWNDPYKAKILHEGQPWSFYEDERQRAIDYDLKHALEERPREFNKVIIVFNKDATDYDRFKELTLKTIEPDWRKTPSGGWHCANQFLDYHKIVNVYDVDPDKIDYLWQSLKRLEIDPLVFKVITKEQE